MGPLKGNVAAAGLRVHTLTHILPCMDKKKKKKNEHTASPIKTLITETHNMYLNKKKITGLMFESAGRNLHCKVIHPEISMEL